jgi:hypothetical protein
VLTAQPAGRVIIRTYRAKSQDRAAPYFQADAARLASQGYFPVSQSWADGRSGCLRIIALGFIGALVWKPDGALTVTYQMSASASGWPIASPTWQPTPIAPTWEPTPMTKEDSVVPR